MSDHEWCRDVQRDEAVRAAEDAAAVPAIQHRDLPEVVADLRERVARLEGAAKTAAKESPAVVANTCGDGGCGPARSGQNSGQAEPEAAPPPRGWLTEEERETVEKCLRHFVRREIDFLERNDHGHRWLEVWRREEAILRALLARSSPQRVKRPNPNVVITTVDARERIDRQWIAAIRAAGGEVEE